MSLSLKGKKNVENDDFSVEIITHNDKKIVEDLLCLEEKCLPLEMRNPVGYDYFSSILNNPDLVNLILKHKGKIVGLLVAKEYTQAYDSISRHDPDLRKSAKKFFYVDVIQINPRFKINGGLSLLIYKLIEKTTSKKLQGFCIHARQKNGLSQFMQRVFQCKKMHSIDNWLGFGEPFDYLELALNKTNLKKIISHLSYKRVYTH